jgi:hypothetical protein
MSEVSGSVVLRTQILLHIIKFSKVLLFDNIISVGALLGVGGSIVIVKFLSNIPSLRSSVLKHIL